MPVYEYQCKACGRAFEYQQRMADPDKTICENCGGELERLISRTAFSLKGGGWYKDLYSSTKPESKPDSKGDKPAESTWRVRSIDLDGVEAGDRIEARRIEARGGVKPKPATEFKPASTSSGSGSSGGGTSTAARMP